MTDRTTRLVGVLLVAGLAALTVALLTDGSWPGLIVLGAGIVLGELFELRPEHRAALPLSFAAFVVLARVAGLEEFLIVVVAAELLAAALRLDAPTLARRAGLFVGRVLEAGAAYGAYRLVSELLSGAETQVQLLAALGAAAIAPIVVADLADAVRNRRLPPAFIGRSADMALITSAVLMAVSVRGIDGEVQLGFWGPMLFSIPLLAAWYSFERLETARKTYRQTIHSLALAPELGGTSADGHADRVADLCVTMGRSLGIGGENLEQLRVAALLHHLGSVCLDTPTDGEHPWNEVAATSAEMLQATPELTPAGEIVAATTRPHRAPTLPYAAQPISSDIALASQVLRVASEFDDLTRGEMDPVVVARAIQHFYSGPGYLYDGRVLIALEKLLQRRGVAVAHV